MNLIPMPEELARTIVRERTAALPRRRDRDALGPEPPRSVAVESWIVARGKRFPKRRSTTRLLTVVRRALGVGSGGRCCRGGPADVAVPLLGVFQVVPAVVLDGELLLPSVVVRLTHRRRSPALA
jgi:hypothetical protein